MSHTKRWARLGGWLGIAWPLLFIVVMGAAEMTYPPSHSLAEELTQLSQPHIGHASMLLHSLGAVIGLLGIGWAVALNSVLQSERPSRSATLAAIFGVAGFAVVTAMLVVQGSVQTGIGDQFAKLTSDADRAATIAAFRSVRWVDLGLDFTWDIFIAWSMILFSVAMLRTRTFGKLWGVLGIVIAATLFALDVRSAPWPAEPDISPISFIWFIGVSVKMLLFARQKTVHMTDQAKPATTAA
jgi:Domain of unknown function (DUF4386)